MVKISKSEIPQGIVIKTEEDYRSERSEERRVGKEC